MHDVAAGVLRGVAALDPSSEDGKILQPYVLDVQQARAEAGKGSTLYVESEAFWIAHPQLRGTPDAALVDPTAKRITIWDLKTGWRPVEAFENWQLVCYAIMLAEGRAGWTLDLRIVQPKPYHVAGPVRSWVLTVTELQPYRQRVELMLAEAIRVQGANARAGAHCLYCEALTDCPAARDVTLGAADHWTNETHELPDDQIARELELLRDTAKIVGLRVAAIEETIKARVRSGRAIAGAVLRESSGGRMTWSRDDATVIATIAALTGINVGRTVPPTPKQAIDAGVPADLVKSIAERKPGKLVVDTDVDALAKQAFGAPAKR